MFEEESNQTTFYYKQKGEHRFNLWNAYLEQIIITYSELYEIKYLVY